MRSRPKLRETGALLRGAPGSARPTTWADAPYGWMRIRLTGCFRFVLLRGTPGSARPTGRVRIRRTFVIISPLLRGRRDAAPYKAAACFPHFLPPAGEGGIRRSPARRMTEEGEPHRLQTVKPLLFPAAGGHFHIEVPPRSRSPVALVGDTLPRWGRDRERALWSCHRGRFSLTTFSHGKRKTCHPAPSPLTTSPHSREPPRFLSAAFPCQFPQDSL